MKAVIFAAGKGKRMLPLTKYTCKPMLYVHNKPILKYILEYLPKEVDEIIIVVGYYAHHIKGYFGKKFEGKKIRYVVQTKPKGTWDALCRVKKYLDKEEKFLVLNADDLHSKKAIKELLKYEDAILISSHVEPEKFGVVEFDSCDNLLKIEEKPEYPKTNFVSVGVYLLLPEIFKCKMPDVINGELYLAKVLEEYLKYRKIKIVKTHFWVPIGNPTEYVNAHKMV